MPSVKIKDNNPTAQKRREALYTLFGEKDLLVTGLVDGNGCFYAKTNEVALDRFLSEDIKLAFENNRFEIVNPPELNALKSIIVRNVDKQVDNFLKDDIIENIINSNDNLKIE